VDSVSQGSITSYTFSDVTTNHTIYASFAINTYTITVTQTSNGTISPGTTTVNYLADPTFTITPITGYHVVDVTVDGSSVGALTSYTFTNVIANHMITATYAINTYTLNVNVGSGGSSVDISPPSGPYTHGTSVTLTPHENTGYHFNNWSGSLNGSANPATITMDGNKNITANFAINTYTITVTQTANGTISPNNPTVNYGANQAFSITPSTGYHVTGVTVDGGSAGAVTSYTFTNVTATHTITATYAINTYALTTISSPIAGGTISGAGTYNYGQTPTVSASANAGYIFTGWSGDLTGNTNPTTILMNGTKTVTANFAQIYTLTTHIGTGGSSITLNPPGGTYTSGTSVTVTANPSSGYMFGSWTDDLTGTSNPTTITMNSNKNITANFIRTYTLTTTSNPLGAGTFTLNPPGGTYGEGTDVVVTESPTSGHQFLNWSGGLGTNPQITVHMDANKTVTANFNSTNTIISTKATYINSGSVNSNYGDTSTITVNTSNRGLIQFSLGSNPGTIDSATLRVYVNSRSATGNIGAYRLTRNWEEGPISYPTNGATWNHAIRTWYGSGYTPWTTPGGDFNSTATGVSPASAAGTWIEINVKSDVEGFFASTTTNYGWLIKPDGSSTANLTLGSDDSSNDPQLVIVYH
jgi:uncharacterized repeat protein (TIGR02543 family)